MFMKHYAPNSCEPSIEALKFRVGVGGGLCKFKKKNGGGVVRGRGGGWGGGVSVDVNKELKFL